METGNRIELNNKVEKFIALLLFACADWIHSAAQERKARTCLRRSSTHRRRHLNRPTCC